MKKLLLITMAVGIGLISFAQKKTSQMPFNSASLSVKAKRCNGSEQSMNSATQQILPLKFIELSGNTVGSTWYDLQSNKSVQNRIIKHDDGTISAIWTRGNSSGDNYSDRGTGYNYFNGTSWSAFPTDRIEDFRTGFPSLLMANGKEIVISHHSAGLAMASRTKGTGNWTIDTIDFASNHALSWARAKSAGISSQKIHLIAMDYMGSTTNGLVYSRSSDAGATWDIQDSVLPGLNPVTEMLPIGGDSYCMDVQGDTIAIVAGDMTTDVVLITSYDGGDTWTHTNVYEHPIPLWNTSLVNDPAGTSDVNGDSQPDTLVVSDGRYSCVIGYDGLIHVFMGITRISRSLSDAADYFTWWPYTDGLVYWRSDQPAIVPQTYFNADTLLNKVGYMVDVNGNDSLDFNTVPSGQFPFGDFGFTSISSMPSAAIDEMGVIYCTYSSVVEGTDCGDGRGYRNIYAIKSVNDGFNWTEPVNITQDDFSECLFGSLSRNVDENLYMVYQRSTDPGITVQPADDNPHIPQENDIIVTVQSRNLIAGIKEEIETGFSVEQNFPNPFNETTTININLKRSADLSLHVRSLIGAEVMTVSKGMVSAGLHNITIDGSKLSPGIYFYTVTAGNSNVTKKMIVQ